MNRYSVLVWASARDSEPFYDEVVGTAAQARYHASIEAGVAFADKRISIRKMYLCENHVEDKKHPSFCRNCGMDMQKSVPTWYIKKSHKPYPYK